MRVQDTIVVVTGASSGIGAATAKALAARGARVVLLARSAGPLKALVQAITAAGGKASAYPVDLADAAATADIAVQIERDLGPPDIVINNAGAGRYLAIDETAPAEAVEMMAAPYFAAFYVTKAFLPAMLRRRSGLLVNLTSPASRLPWPGAIAYSAARWAMRGFNEALAADLYRTGLRTMLVTPGKVASTYFAHNPGSEERIPTIAKLIPSLTPDDVAEAIINGIEKNKRTVVVPFLLRVSFALHYVCPRGVAFLFNRTGWRRPQALPSTDIS